ncbi:helix-turn-helix domain-containing protein, partial [Thermus scotoductus]|uniref:helix-turn-helix domain-containing protein n=1 Tax=Thermus scotoductus TaxID=37636 RepID=UPI0020A490A2
MCELGERLRRAREEKGLSLKEASARLALKAKVLEALEACRFEELPEPALTRGYLRRYALLLGLDPRPHHPGVVGPHVEGKGDEGRPVGGKGLLGLGPEGLKQ